MFLYSSDGLARVVGGSTAAQMETKIANELPSATEAATNSEIDLQFNLVHTGPVSVVEDYVVRTAMFISSIMATLETDLH